MPDQLQSLGAQYPEGNRTANRGGVYNYLTNASVSVTSTPDGYATRPVQYSSVIGFGAGSSGSAEILAEWTGGGYSIYHRALRDTYDNWFDWCRFYDDNYHPYADRATNDADGNEIKSTYAIAADYLPLKGGNLTGYITSAGSAPQMSAGLLFVDSVRPNTGQSMLTGSALVFGSPGTMNDQAWIRTTATNENDLRFEIGVGDDGATDFNIHFTGYDVSSNAAVNIVLLKQSGTVALSENTWPLKSGIANTNWLWGALTAANGYSQLFSYDTTSGANIGFAEMGGQMSMQIDGRIYDQEGNYRLVDTHDLAAYFSYDSSSMTLKIGS